MLGLPQHQQAAFVGLRSTFYKLAMITGQGGLVYLAGHLTETTGNMQLAWSIVLAIPALLFVALALYHQLALPRPAEDRALPSSGHFWRDYLAVFAAFFKKPDILTILGFVLVFRLGEAQLLKLATPFLLDPRTVGGLGMTTAQVGIVYGSIGVGALVLGGLLGGFLVSRFGLKRCLWPMMFAIHLPDLVFVYLATAMPENLYVIAAAIAVEQFGYGCGFAALLLYMVMVADGAHKTAHYALCTGFMALGMMLPGMASGWIQQMLGYQHFFIWACISTLPAFFMASRVKIAPAFGKK